MHETGLEPMRPITGQPCDAHAVAMLVARFPDRSPQELESMSGASRSTFRRHLSEAVNLGYIERSGNTRNTSYRATRRFFHQCVLKEIAKPAEKRPLVPFQPEVIDEYEPNRTFWLPRDVRERLQQACPGGTYNLKGATYSQDVRRFMTDIAYNSSIFEGVNAKYADTIALLEENIQSSNISTEHAAILRNHYNAIRFIIENIHYPARNYDLRLDSYNIRSVHSMLSDGLLKDRRQQGMLREGAVIISHSAYAPTVNFTLLRSQFESLLTKVDAVQDPYEQAFVLAVAIPYLQPFIDCNKRTSRICCNIPLLQKGILPISWSNINQDDYNDALVCFYERQSLYGMSEIFEAVAMRSIEHFEHFRGARNPKRFEITYAQEIACAIRNHIQEGVPLQFPPSIPPDDQRKLLQYTQDVLTSIIDNEMVATVYRIDRRKLHEWREMQIAPMWPENTSPSPGFPQ